MTESDPPLDDQARDRLYQQICVELGTLFSHAPEDAYQLLASYRAKHSWHDDNAFSHEGPFGMALRVHYEMVLNRDMSSVAFLDWRKKFTPTWKARLRD